MLFLHRRRQLSVRALVPGRYLTDGRRLLRIVSRFDDGRSVMVLLEDCRTLCGHAWTLIELRAMGFRRVRIMGPHPAGEAHPVETSDGLLEGSRRSPV